MRLSDSTLDALRKLTGLTPTVSDVLDELGLHLVVSASVVIPRQSPSAPSVGHAVTSAYVPRRSRTATTQIQVTGGKVPEPLFDPGHRTAQRGDVLVLAAQGTADASVFGGRLAMSSREAGVDGVVVDGCVRDLDEIHAAGLPVWSRWVTPISGKNRMEQVSSNEPIHFAGVQVHPGDLVIADQSGVCFVPAALAEDVARRVVQIAAAEAPSR
jgi:4-hydroxy-4-methyl-2-oxoglutarate aldolase